jgi:hypothetical protein
VYPLLSFSTINLQAGPYGRGTAIATLPVYQWAKNAVHRM